MSGEKSTEFWVAIAEGVLFVLGVLEEVIRRCCRKRKKRGEGAELTVEGRDIEITLTNKEAGER